MKRRQIVGTMTGVLAAGVVIASVLPGTGSRTSANGARHFNCTNETLEDRYPVIGGGFIPGGAPPAPLIPSVHMSLMTLDGAGSLIDKVTVSDGVQVH
jgi:hypothetical protein